MLLVPLYQVITALCYMQWLVSMTFRELKQNLVQKKKKITYCTLTFMPLVSMHNIAWLFRRKKEGLSPNSTLPATLKAQAALD